MRQSNLPLGIVRYRKTYRGYILVLLVCLTTIVVWPLRENSISYKHSKPSLSMLATSVARKQGVDPKLVRSIVSVESSWRSSSVSSKDAIGLMQVHHPTWSHKWTRKQLKDPETNLIAGSQILKHYIQNSRSLEEALHKYSGGAKDYHKKVMRRMQG